VRLSGDHTAIDIDAEALVAARSAYPDFEFELFDGRRIPFDDAVFDLVVSWTVLQHVRPGLTEDVLADILRLLGPDGVSCSARRHVAQVIRHGTHGTASRRSTRNDFTPCG
jgi:ubiquinone/menaquinone biosynthesis C-methylase UbiE